MQGEGQTGLDRLLSLDAVYYSAPVPRDTAVLTALGVIFDRVHFPGVYLPLGGFDQSDLDREIERLDALPGMRAETENLTGILRFVKHARTLQDFCVFAETPDEAFGKASDELAPLANDLFDAMYGKPREGFTPIFSSAHTKAMPGSEECIAYRGDFYYPVGAMVYSARTGIPLLNDVAALPVVGARASGMADDLPALMTALAVQCARLVLPEMARLSPEHVMEFRDENAAHLRQFRAGLLGYAGLLNKELRNLPPGEIEAATAFFVNTEIAPALADLQEAAKKPARSWLERGAEVVRMMPELASVVSTMDLNTLPGRALALGLPALMADAVKVARHRAQLKQSKLYYLLTIKNRFA